MKKILKLIILCGNLLFCSDIDDTKKNLKKIKILSPLMEWIGICRNLTPNRSPERLNPDAQINDSAFGADTSDAWENFTPILTEGLKAIVAELRAGSWLGDSPEYVQDHAVEIGYQSKIPFTPFVKRLEVNPGDKVIFFGDRHGDCHSLANDLEDLHNKELLDDSFKLTEGVNIIFLGDYVDRGRHGAEVIATLLSLKIVNQNQVFMVRGNHEDLEYQKAHKTSFIRECMKKFGTGLLDPALRAKQISTIYDLMPVALYLGCRDCNDYLQCCHGGMEAGYNPTCLLNSDKNFQLLGELKRTKGVIFGKEYPLGDARCYFLDIKPTNPLGIEFCWGDFDAESTKNHVFYGRSLCYGKGAVEELLELQNTGVKKVCGVFRGHQHGDPCLMSKIIKGRGFSDVWEEPDVETYPKSRLVAKGLVSTFNVAPDTNIGKVLNFNFDSYGALTIVEKYEEWAIQIVNTYAAKDTPLQTVQQVLKDCAGGGASAADEDGEDKSEEKPQVVCFHHNTTSLASALEKIDKEAEAGLSAASKHGGSSIKSRTELATVAIWMNLDGSFEASV